MTGTWREKNVSAMSSTGGGNTARSRAKSPRTCSGARLVVAVEATIFGPVSTSPVGQPHSSSTAASNSPTVVPSAPEIRCSSSWMIRSGGRSRMTGWLVTAGSLARRLSLCLGRQPVRSSRSSCRYPCRGQRELTRPNSIPAYPCQGSCASLSTVAMTRLGSSR